MPPTPSQQEEVGKISDAAEEVGQEDRMGEVVQGCSSF